jgi:hypothetical protein
VPGKRGWQESGQLCPMGAIYLRFINGFLEFRATIFRNFQNLHFISFVSRLLSVSSKRIAQIEDGQIHANHHCFAKLRIFGHFALFCPNCGHSEHGQNRLPFDAYIT